MYDHIFELETRKNAARLGFELNRLAILLNLLGLLLLGRCAGYLFGLLFIVNSYVCAWMVDSGLCPTDTRRGRLAFVFMGVFTAAGYVVFFVLTGRYLSS